MSRLTLKTRGAALRRSVSALVSGPQRRYPPALLRRIEAYARERVTQGASRAQICREVGISAPTLERVLRTETGTLRPVRIQAPEDTDLSPQIPSAIRVRGPGGIVVEGLDVAGVAALVRELG